MLNAADPRTSTGDQRRWLALTFIALAQLMIALDATIVSIALPSAQRDLGASDADRQWVLTAYTVAFGALLLAGGKVSDLLGRKRAFLIGLGGFALASAVGGSAGSYSVLLLARAAQGAFAALLAPTALSLLAVTFTEARERATAFAVYGAIAGSGAAVGLLLGGVLTEYAGWRWCLYVNLPIAVIAAAGGWRVLPSARLASSGRIDVPGVLLIGGGLGSLVYACSRAVTDGWRPAVIGWFVVCGVLIVGFVLRESRASAPLLPLSIVRDRNRAGASLAAALAVAAMFGGFLFLTYYLQVVLRYTPLQAGITFLPLTFASQAGSWGIARLLMPRLAARWIMAPGALVAALGMIVLGQVGTTGSSLPLVLAAEILLGIGIACVMSPAFNVGTLGVDRHYAGVAAATVNAAVQVGASIGTALLNGIAVRSTAAYLAGGAPGEDLLRRAAVHGYSTALLWAAALLLLCSVVAAVLITARAQLAR